MEQSPAPGSSPGAVFSFSLRTSIVKIWTRHEHREHHRRNTSAASLREEGIQPRPSPP
jgi:hypothetical protein